MIRFMIFDLDGTLVNSVYDLADATNYALQKFNHPVHELHEFNMFVGNGIPKLIERALPEDCRTAEHIEETKKYFDEYYSEHYLDKTRPYDGILKLVDTLKKDGIKLAVASNKQQNYTERIINKIFGNSFDYIYGSRKDIPNKPSADCVHIIMNELGATTANTVFVGDSDVDILTAKNSELKSIGCLWGFRTEKELIDSGADYIASEPEKIAEIVKNIK